MPQMFNIVAQVQFESNVNSAVARMKQQFSTLGKGTFISPTASRGVTELTGNLQKLQVRLDAVATSARQVNQAFSSFKDSAKGASAMNALASSSAKSAAAAARTAKNVQAATKEVDQFGRAVAIASKRFVAFQVAAPAIYAVQNAFSDAIKQAAQFDREMVRIQQVGSDSAATMGDLSTEIGRLSKGLGVSSLGLAQVATTLRQAGLSAADVKTSLSALAKTELTPTFKNINNTVEGSIALMRQFGLGARDLESALGSVNTVSAQFAVESEDLVEVIRKAGSSFKSASSSFTAPRESLNQLLALFTSVRDTTRESADSIGTGFRTIFARLQSNEVAKGLRDLGINLHYTANEAALLGQNVEGQFVGAFTAIRRLSEATKGLQTTDPRFSAIAEQIGGIRQISRVLPLLQQFETTQRALTAAQTGSNSLTRDATKANDAFLVKLSKVKEEFVDLVRTIGNDRGFRAFLDFSLKLASSLTAITRALTPLLPALATLGTIKLAGSIGRGFGSLSARPARGYALGGYVGDDTGVVPGRGSGDIVPAQLRDGQFVIKKASARKLGYGNLGNMAKRGTQDAMVEPGEYMFSQRDANRIGYNNLDMMNRTGRMPGYASGGVVQTSHGRVKTSPYGRSYNLDQFEQQNVGQRVRLRRVEADPDTGEATPRARFYAEHRKNRFSKRIGFAKGGRSKKKRDLAAEWMASQGQSLEAVVDTPLNDEINANTGAGKVRRPRTSAFVKDLRAFGSSFGEGEIDIDAPRFAQQDVVANRIKAMQMMKAERDARVAAQTERIAGLVSEGKIPKYERDLSEKALTSSLPAGPVRQKGRASSPRLATGVKLPVPAKFSASTPAIPQTAVSSGNIDEIISKVQGLDPNFDPGNVPDAVRRLSKISPGMDPREAKLLMNNLLGVSSPAPLPASATTKRKRKPRTKKGAGAIIPPTPPVAATGSGDSPEKRRNRGFTNGPNYQGELDFYDVPSMFGAFELHSDQNPLGNVNPFPTAAEVQEAKRQQQAQQRMLASEIQSMRMGRQGVYSQTMHGGSTRPSLKNSPFAVNDRPGRVLDAQRIKDVQRLAENPEVQAIRSMGASPAPQVGNLEALASSLGLFGAAGRNRGSAPWEPEGTTRRSREIDAIRGMGGYADLTQRQTNRRTQAAQAKRDAAQAKRDAEVADSQKRFEEIDALRSMNSKRNRTPNLGSTYGQRRAREARDATRQRQYQERIDAGNAAIDQAIAVNDIRSGVTRGPRREFSTTPELRNQLQARRREAGQYGWNDRATLDLHLDMKQANSEKKMLDLGMDQTGRKLSSKERAEGYKKFYAENPLLDPNSDFQKARKARTRSLNRGESQALNATRRGFRGDLSQFFQQSQGLNIEDAIARADKALERNERVEFNRAGSIKAVLPNRGLFGKVSETLGGVGRFDVGARLRNSRLGRSNLGRRAAIGARKLGRQVGGSGRFAALGLAAASTSLLLPQDDPNGPPDKANAARMGATTGATTGGAIGLQFGPLAGAIGALVGGVIGYTSALKDAEKQIAEFEFDKSFKEFEYSLSGLASGLRKIDQGGISAIIGGVGRAQTEASRRTKEEGVGGFFDRNLGRGSTFESVTQTAPKGFLNSLALSASVAGIPAPLATGGAKTLATIPDFISNKLGFGNVSENLFSSNEDLFKQEGAKRQAKLTDILSPQLPAFQQIGERIAQSIKLSEADFRGDPESRRTAILSQFDQKGGGKIADTIASVGEIPLNEVRQNFLKVAIESNQLRLQHEGLKKSVNLTTLQFQKFGRLEQALDSVTVSIEEMRSGLDTTAALFNGDLSASKTGNFSSRLGDQDPSRFGRNAAFLEANLGSGGGNLAGNFTQALKEVDTVLRDGSGVVSQAISKGGLDPELIGNQLRGAFASDSFGLSKDSQSKLGAAIDAIDPKELIDKARTNSQKLIEELVQQAFGDMPDQMQGLTKKITEQMDNFAQGLAQASQQVQQATESRGRVASLQLGSQRASAQSRAFSSGRFSQAGDLLSLDQLRQPFNTQQRLLAGKDAGDPDAIFNTFKSVQAQIEQADQRLKDPSLKPGERGATLESRSGLVLQASNLQKALEHLADTSEETASIQEKLNDVERQRQSGLNVTERLLTGSTADKRQLRKAGGLTDIAVGQGDFRGFNAKNVQAVLEYLRSIGDMKLPGYGNRTGNDLSELLLSRSGGQISGNGLGGLGRGPILNPNLAAETDRLLKEQVNVAGRGEQAGGRVADIKDSLAAKFLDNLKSTNEQFLSKMDALLNAANIKDKQSALDRANVEQGVAKDRLGKAQGLARDFGVQGDGLEQAKRLVNAPEFNNFRDARAARLNINQKNPIAQAKIAQAFSGKSGIADVFGTSVPFVNKIAKGTSEDQKRAFLESHKNALFTAAPAIASNTGLTTGDVNNVALPKYLSRQQSAADRGQAFDTGKELNKAISEAVSAAKLNIGSREVDARKDVAHAAYGTDSDEAKKKVDKAADNFLDISKKLGELDSIQSFAQAQREFTQALEAATKAANERAAAEGSVPVVRKAMGGSIFKPHGTDTVPAMLTPGEYVVNARAARSNKALLDEMNYSGGAKYLASGGLVDERLAKRNRERDAHIKNQTRIDNENRDRLQAKIAEYKQSTTYGRGITAPAAKGKLSKRNERFLKYFESATQSYEGGTGNLAGEEIQKAQRGYQQLMSLQGTFDPRVERLRKKFFESRVGGQVRASLNGGGMGGGGPLNVQPISLNRNNTVEDRIARARQRRATKTNARARIVNRNQNAVRRRLHQPDKEMPAMLSPGEAVVNANAARKNRGTLDQINKPGVHPIYRASGGSTGGPSGGSSASGSLGKFDETLSKFTAIVNKMDSAMKSLAQALTNNPIPSQIYLKIEPTRHEVILNGGAWLNTLQDNMKQMINQAIAVHFANYDKAQATRVN